MLAGSSPALSYAPVRDGSNPHINEARDGTQSGEAQRARSKTTLSSPIRSRCGARTIRLP
jgi:hypothetical protein